MFFHQSFSAPARLRVRVPKAFCRCLWSASIKKGKKREGKKKERERKKEEEGEKKRKEEEERREGFECSCCPLCPVLLCKATSKFTYYLPCRLDYLGDFTTLYSGLFYTGSRFAAHRDGGLHQHSYFHLCTLLIRPTQVVDRDPLLIY